MRGYGFGKFSILIFGGILFSALSSATIQALELPDGFVDELVAEGLDTPVALAPLPDGRIVVLEQYNGSAYMLSADRPRSRSLLYEFSDVNVKGGNERGLLSVAVDPLFSTNGYLYFYYTAKGNHCRLTRFTLSSVSGEGSAGSEGSVDTALQLKSRLNILWDIPDNAWNHNGGTLRFGPDGMLYVSIGDDANSCIAQTTADLRGSILRLDVRLTSEEEKKLTAGDKSVLVGANNPFAGKPGENARLIYAYGLRNPFRFAIDPATGDMLIADVGLLDFEEIDYVPYANGGGENFGWPFFEGPAPRAEPGCKKSSSENYIQPAAYYDRTGYAASVISLCLYRPDNPKGKYTWPKEYFGDYFYLDYFKGFVRRLKLDKQGNWFTPNVVAGQADSLNWAVNFRSVPDAFVGSDGALYYLRQFDNTYSEKSGQLRRIIYREPPPQKDE